MQAQLKIAICDDLQTDRELLRAYITDFINEKKIIAEIDEYSCGEEFLKCDSEIYNLVFLDIFMSGINGIETAKKLVEKNEKTKLIFCSASAEFAVESYEVYALHYLLKPVSRAKLNLVLERFFAKYFSVQSIEVNVGRKKEKIYISDIMWVESARKKCIFHTKHGEVEVIAKFSEVFEKLSAYDFIKPIRYAIVPLKEISNIRTDITLSNGAVIPISRDMRESVKNTFADYNWKIMLQKAGGGQ